MKLLRDLLSRKIKASVVGILVAMTTAGEGLHNAYDDHEETEIKPNAVVERVLQEEVSNKNAERIEALVDLLNIWCREEFKKPEEILEKYAPELIIAYRKDSDRVEKCADTLYEALRILTVDSRDSNFQDVNPQTINVLREELKILNIQDDELDSGPLSQFIIFIVFVLIIITAILAAIHLEEKNLGKGENKFFSKS